MNKQIELVDIKLVKAEYKKNPKYSLKMIIESANIMEAKKVIKKDFDAAMEFPECPTCHKRSTEDKVVCPECEKRERQAAIALKKYEEEQSNWIALYEKLNSLTNGVGYSIFRAAGVLEISAIKYTDEKSGHNFRIYREAIYHSNSGWSCNNTHAGYALRISTSDYDLNASKLRRDFDKVKASDLHTKGIELINSIISKDEAKRKKANTKNLKLRLIEKAFPNHKFEVAKEYSYSNVIRNNRETGRLEFTINNTKITTWDGKEFCVKGLPGSFTPGQVEKLTQMAKDFSIANKVAKETAEAK